MATQPEKKSLHTVGGKAQPPQQKTLRGKSVTYEEFPADMADPLGEAFMDGDLIPLEDILSEIVTVTGIDAQDGLYGPYLTIHLADDRLFNIGSAGVTERMNKIRDKLPMDVVFVKKDLAGGKRMYSVVTPATFERMQAE